MNFSLSLIFENFIPPALPEAEPNGSDLSVGVSHMSEEISRVRHTSLDEGIHQSPVPHEENPLFNQLNDKMSSTGGYVSHQDADKINKQTDCRAVADGYVSQQEADRVDQPMDCRAVADGYVSHAEAKKPVNQLTESSVKSGSAYIPHSSCT